MPKRKTVFTQGHYYHIYNRGANRERIFFNQGNYLYCLRLMKKYFHHYQIAVIAYCLMPNHYHFLLRQDGEVAISQVIGWLFNAYVLAVNNQDGRSGTLFEGRFRDVHVEQENYLVHLCRYIHANPVKGVWWLIQASGCFRIIWNGLVSGRDRLLTGHLWRRIF